ncbi:ATP-binding protein [[Phormidium] sp. ETS-05]|uniref:ATP-binding protein n=1 Tax=[Phormidium] sp. ETS-05 TaxID=222819 RepID=UPI0018EECFAE|nr:ATP-binding protein [[Phormidium] sp. ETS-05]
MKINISLFWWHQLPIRIRGSLIIAIPVTCLFAALSTFAWLKNSMMEDDKWVEHTQVVRLETKLLLNALIDAETGVRGYGLTLRPEFLTPYHNAIQVIPASLKKLEVLVSDNPSQILLLREINQITAENLDIFYQKVTLQTELKKIRGSVDVLVPAASLYEWLEEGKATMDEARMLIDRFAQTEEQLLKQRQAHHKLHHQITWIALCIFSGLGAIGFWLSMHLFYQLEQELANRELNLQESNQRLQVVCQQLQRFTANASHELRTPLAAVLSNAQVGIMALSDLGEVEAAEDLEDGLAAVQGRLQKIVKLAKNMSDLVGQLLFLARHEGGLAAESFRQLNLTELVDNLLADFVPEAESNQLQLNYQSSNDLIMVNGESSLLPQAIANLLNNAFRYTPPGGSVDVTLFVEDNWAIVAVKDTGIGIPEEELEQIFERFYRVADKADRLSSKGFGLGLAITQQIVQLHRGKIEVSSTINHGSTFQISLPLAS